MDYLNTNELFYDQKYDKRQAVPSSKSKPAYKLATATQSIVVIIPKQTQ